MFRKSTILPDTTLCAIVRDEKMNPAGGIERFVESHVPFVEQVVIADTGSVDGTREILEELQSRYSNRRVIDIPFNGYSGARNEAMKHVQTKRVLVLDADELLTHKKPQNDFRNLGRFIENHPSNAYEFGFLAIPPSGNAYIQFNAHFIRLFDISENWEFTGDRERLSVANEIPTVNVKNLWIKHFVPSKEIIDKKRRQWYTPLDTHYLSSEKTAPSEVEGFAEWKAYNPLRDKYI